MSQPSKAGSARTKLLGGRRGTAPEAVDNGRGTTENGVAMKTLEALRDQTLHKLASHYAVGDLRLGTLEHRVEQALTAESPSASGDRVVVPSVKAS